MKNQQTESNKHSNGHPPPPMVVGNKTNDGKQQQRKRNRSDMEQRHDINDNDNKNNSEEQQQQHQNALPSSSKNYNNNNKELHTKRVRTTIDDSATTITTTNTTTTAADSTSSTALVEYSLLSTTPPPKPPSTLSIEALLSVPLTYILRQTNSTTKKNNNTNATPSTPSNQNFLLSRVEATILLQISQLAHEMDTLTSMTLQALDKSRIVRDLNDSIHRPSTSSTTTTTTTASDTTPNGIHTLYLRAIEPLLRIHGRTIPQRVLQHVQAETERILGDELPSLGRTLRQFSEQNWSVANTLLDTMDNMRMMMGNGAGGNVETLAREKKAVAEFEEEVCRRIDRLVRMGSSSSSSSSSSGTSDGTSNVPLSSFPEKDNIEDETGDSGDAFEMAMDPQTGTFISMAEFCDTLLEDSVIEDIEDVAMATSAVVEYVAKRNVDLDGAHSGGGTKIDVEIPNRCSSIGGDPMEGNKTNDSDGSPCNEENGDHFDLKLTTDTPSSEAKDPKRKSPDHNRPTLVQSHQNCNAAGSMNINDKQHVHEDDGDDINDRCNETQAPLMTTTSNSLDDAATALGLLSSGKPLDGVMSIDSKV